MQTRIERWGNSLVLRIPNSFADRLGMVECGVVELSVDEGQLTVRPQLAALRLEELLARITPENLPVRFDDAPVGREVL